MKLWNVSIHKPENWISVIKISVKNKYLLMKTSMLVCTLHVKFSNHLSTTMCCLTLRICSTKCIIRWFPHCEIILEYSHKDSYYITKQYNHRGPPSYSDLSLQNIIMQCTIILYCFSYPSKTIWKVIWYNTVKVC